MHNIGTGGDKIFSSALTPRATRRRNKRTYNIIIPTGFHRLEYNDNNNIVYYQMIFLSHISIYIYTRILYKSSSSTAHYFTVVPRSGDRQPPTWRSSSSYTVRGVISNAVTTTTISIVLSRTDARGARAGRKTRGERSDRGTVKDTVYT